MSRKTWISFRATEEDIAALEALRVKLGLPNRTAVIRKALAEWEELSAALDRAVEWAMITEWYDDVCPEEHGSAACPREKCPPKRKRSKEFTKECWRMALMGVNDE